MSLYIRYPASGGGSGISVISVSAPLVSSGGSSPNLSLNSSIPVWTKYTVNYTQLAAAATSNTILLFTMGPNDFVHAPPIIYATTSFSGGGSTSCNITVGTVAGGYTELINLYNAFQPVTGTSFRAVSQFKSSFITNTDIYLKITMDVNLNTITAGVVNLWVFKSTLP